VSFKQRCLGLLLVGDIGLAFGSRGEKMVPLSDLCIITSNLLDDGRMSEYHILSIFAKHLEYNDL
jgi:hypothetical protein